MARTIYRSSEDVDAAETYPMVTWEDLRYLTAAEVAEFDYEHAAEQAEIDERTDSSEDVR